MIKRMRMKIGVDCRGKISTGGRTEAGKPQKLDYFNILDFSELVEWYGEAPERLLVFAPSDEITDFFDATYEAWGQKDGEPYKKRICDGEECIHRIKETVDGRTFEAGEISECVCESLDPDHKDRCRCGCYSKWFVANPQTRRIENPTCYLFINHSINSAEAIYSELKKIRDLNAGVLRNVPFALSVRMVGSRESGKKKFPIWSLQAVGMLSEIQRVSRTGPAPAAALPPASGAESIVPDGKEEVATYFKELCEDLKYDWDDFKKVISKTEKFGRGTLSEKLLAFRDDVEEWLRNYPPELEKLPF